MKRANELKLNIGLNNNPFLVNEILEHIKYSGIFIDNEFNHSVDLSEYKNEIEQTLIIEGLTSFKLSTCADIIERLCSVFTQDCIASKIDNNEVLIYSETYKGEKMQFNNDYFISINSKDKSNKLLINDTELRAFELLDDSKDCLHWITEQPEYETLKKGSSAKEVIKEIEEFFKMI
jgi:hypothetical protein